ncbi:nuclear transport factor 2 family protein [Rummeliibacillus sp. JY-2-4R]
MIFRKLALVSICALMLAACGNNNSAKETNAQSGSTSDTDYTSQNNSINHGITDTKQAEPEAGTPTEDSTANSSSTKEETKSTSKDETKSTSSQADDQIGFELNSDGKVDEAKSIPSDEKKAIVGVFNEYIDAFNDQDIDRYAKTISKNPKGFNYDEEIDYTKQAFKEYKVTRTAKNITIKKYKKDYAEVFANIKTVVKQDNNSFTQPLNQVTVMTKENGKWGISAVYVMGTKE